MSRRAESIVRDRFELILRDWRASCVTHESVDHWLVLDGVADALGRCAGHTRGGHRHDDLDEAYGGSLLDHLHPRDVTCLREVVRRQVLLDLGPDEAVTVSHCVSTVLDGLHERAAERLLAEADTLARTDALTGLGNRRAADEAVVGAFASAERHDRPLVVLSIDLDHLKAVNDAAGHDAGDAVLVSLAEALRHGMRAGDSAFRVGGDEFVVVLPETTLEDAAVAVDRIRAAGAPPFSVGMAAAPAEAADADSLRLLADHRLIDGRRVARGAAAAPRISRRRVRVVAIAVLLTLVLLPAVAAGHRAWFDDNAGLALGTAVLAAAAVAAGSGLSYRTNGRSPLVKAVLVPLSALLVANVAVVGAHVRDRAPKDGLASPEIASAPASNPSFDGPMPFDPPGSTDAVVPVGAGEPAPAVEVPPSPPAPRPSALVSTPAPSGSRTSGAASTAAPHAPPPAARRPAPKSQPAPEPQRAPEPQPAPTPSEPVEARDDYGVVDGRQAKIAVLDNDVAEGDLDVSSLQVVAEPSSGKAVVQGNGTITYHARGDATSDSFRYRVCDAAGRCAEATVVVDRAG